MTSPADLNQPLQYSQLIAMGMVGLKMKQAPACAEACFRQITRVESLYKAWQAISIHEKST